jgi:hypothetical protein
MAQEVAKRLNESAEFFLVARSKVPDIKTGQKRTFVASNVGTESALDMAATGTTRFMLKKLADKARRKSRGNT